MVKFGMVQLGKIIFAAVALVLTGTAVATIIDLGEKDFSHYYDATEPVYEKNSITGKVDWKDQSYLNFYPLFHTKIDLLELNHFIMEDLSLGAACSKEDLQKNREYLQYSHRLVVLSYLLELNQTLDFTAKKLMMGNVCHTDWSEVRGKCRPKTETMKFFLKNTGQIISQIRPVRVSAAGSGKKYWSGWYKEYKQKNFSNPSVASVRGYCDVNGCKVKKLKDVKKALPEICEYNRKLFVQICSEKDELEALSYIPEMYELVGRSNILNSIDSDTNAEGCLRVYSMVSGRTEKKDKYLARVIPSIYSTLTGNSTYIQGRLFPAGALMEFNIKGLVQVFEDVKKIEKSISAPKKEEFVKTSEPTPEITKPVKKIVAVSKPKIKPKKKEKKRTSKVEVKKSAFLHASEFREKYDLEKVKVDMFKFKYDYVFTLERVKKLESSLEQFMRRESLQEMKKIDFLGTQKAPVPLIFIKFMIDSNKHIGLFNLTAVLGQKFYVKNTIDGVAPTWDYVNLINDESTGNKWQLFIVKNKDN